MPVAEGLQVNGSRRRAERQTTSCTECRRRKQKCSQGQPCTNCVRRFPQPICEYKTRTRTVRSLRPLPPGIPPSPAYSSVALKEGPYSHLTLFGVQDAILQVEDAPISADSPESVASHSSSDRSTSPASPTEAPPTPFVPFKVSLEVENDIEEKLESLRVIFERRLSVATLIPDDQSAYRNAETVLAVQARHNVQSPVESAMDQFRYLPMVPTKMNKELVRIHLQLLCRFKVSVDGSPAPNNPFMKHWVPFCVQDPLLLQIVLFTSACFLAETGHIPKSLALMHKGAAYQMLNYHLRHGETQTSDAAILGVAQMVVDSWYWGGTFDLKSHIAGLKEMITLRGGLANLGMHGYISKTILIHDVVMALAHEIKPCIYGQPGFEFNDPILMPFHVGLNSPLITGWPTFAACANSLQLNFYTAQILDNTRYLIEMVLALPNDAPIESLQALLVAAARTNDQLAELPEDLPSRRSVECSSPASEGQSPGSHKSARSDNSSPPIELPDLMYRCVRMTATIYCRAILNRVSTSEICTEMDFYRIWQLVWQLGLPTWKAAIGIFVWIMLAIVPSCHKTGPARFIKTLMVAGFMTIGVDNWHIALDIANRSFKLQEWLAGESIDVAGKGLSGGEHIVEKYGFAIKEALPELQLPMDE